MTLEEIKKRLEEIITLLSKEDTTAEEVEALEKEADKLEEEKRSIVAASEKRAETLNKVKKGLVGTTVEVVQENRKEEVNMEKRYASKEYRNAYLKDLLGLELNEEERAAFVHTTDNTPNPVPTTMLNEIWDLVSGEHAILEDITIYRTGTVIEINKHTEIKKGRAKVVAQGAANDDEENTILKVTLSGKDFSKSVELSYAMAKMSIEAFEDYLKNEIATNLGEVIAEDVIAQIKKDMSNDNVVTSADANNITYKEVANTFAKLKKAKKVFVYVNQSTLYSQLCGMVDDNGRPIYQPNANDDAKGSLLGGQVRIDEAVADGEILIGDSKKVVMNMVQDIIVEDDKDIKAHKYIYSGYARGEAVLMYDKAFALLKLKTSTTTTTS